jgi:hypothetical protein
MEVGQNSGFQALTQTFIDMSEKNPSCFGSKRSLVRIQSPRPSYLFNITSKYEKSPQGVRASKTADCGPETSVKVRVGRAKFGHLPVVTTRINSIDLKGESLDHSTASARQFNLVKEPDFSTPGPSPPGPGSNTTYGQLLQIIKSARGEPTIMARIRTVKPALARNRELFEMEMASGIPFRFVWAMFSTICDREGRFVWRPWEIKLDILPYDDIDFERVMNALATRGFIEKYKVGNEEFGCVPTFLRHQVINNKEKTSELPDPKAEGSSVITVSEPLPTREPRVCDACLSPLGKDQGEGNMEGNMEGKGKEGKGNLLRKGEKRDKPDRTPTAPVPIGQSLVAEYCSAWKAKYNERPVMMGDDTKKLKRLGETLGVEKAAELIRGYFQVPNSWFATKRHDVQTLMSNLNVVQHFVATGQTITAEDARNVEAGDSLKNQLKRLGGGAT